MVRPREWDAQARAAAERFDAGEPAWTVFYGVWTRRYFAIANWRAYGPLMVDAARLDDLRQLMREAESPHARTVRRPIAAA